MTKRQNDTAVGGADVAVEAQEAAKRGGPMSVARVIGIMEMLAVEPMSLATLANRLAAPKPSLLNLLGELTVLGVIRRDEAGLYILGGRAFRLASKMSFSGSLSTSVRTTLIEVSRALEAAVSIGYLDHHTRTLVYADRYGEASAVRYVVKFGAAIQLHTRATAKLLVAHESEETWREWFGPEPYQQLTPRSHTRFATLYPELVDIRNSGIAWTCSEQYEGISGCAVPVYGSDDMPAAGLGMVMIGEAMERNRTHVLSVLQAAADTISAEFHLRRITNVTLAQYL
ncbi:MAG TPA: IclR family transcriptional regulator C-terminal domain-containing protein [Noviherbaspirillum sp.]|jgi:DNA-binding IclR family transcriptional regulator|uniref:IclR family transcriptional regulator n=1 Tax=Noviherbaspirillum sp. TaxID=1926288 RepID=UPI002DDD5922|nr:IclR family transcriptional regulator C-terminal domain-containing protein [Noviherbaspirillum sp.]HEV2610093.1 IclR family transcriptional regulator C-terminal domain-containing protein [Noviherbaspirillum sp.]